MNTAEKLASFIGANKMRAEALFRLVQTVRSIEPPSVYHDRMEILVNDIESSYKEVFGCEPGWKL